VGEFQAAIDALAAGNVDAARVEDIRSHIRYALPMSLETPDDVASLLAEFFAATGDPLAVEAHLQRVSEVTPEDVVRVAATWLTAARRNVVTLSPVPAAAATEGGAE